MSWREILGAPLPLHPPNAHNSQNTQNPVESGNCADIADSAYRNSIEEDSKLMEALADVCRGLAITPTEVKEALSTEDIDDWCYSAISTDTLAAFARSLEQRREMDQGKRPVQYTEQATCEHCGPIWLWFNGEVMGCPWCWNRVADKPIPRPITVRCGDCIHFERTRHPHLGHCVKNRPEPIVGMWDTDRHHCELFLPRLHHNNNDQS